MKLSANVVVLLTLRRYHYEKSVHTSALVVSILRYMKLFANVVVLFTLRRYNYEKFVPYKGFSSVHTAKTGLNHAACIIIL